MEHLVDQFASLGLSEKEARAYIALLELGQATAYAVAKKAGIKRPTTYLALDELRKRGLALKVPKAKNQLFIAKSPMEFFAAEEERVARAKRMLPELMAIARMKPGTSQILYFEGMDGITEALRYRLKDMQGKEVLCFYGGTTKPLHGQTLKLYQEYYASLAAQRTRTRAFAPKDPNIEPFREWDEAEYRQVITLPASAYTGPVSLVEIDEYWTKIILHRDRQALIIENQKFTALLRQLFEMLWAAKTR